MNTIIIGSAIALIIGIFVLLFRVQSLISVARGSDKQVGSFSNKLNAGMFLVFMFGLGGWFFYYTFTADYNLPEAASEHGLVTDNLFLVTMIIILFAFLVTNVLLFVFSYKYQYDENRKAKFYPENEVLEIAWTVIPAIVLTFLVFKGYQSWTDITTIPEKDKDLNRVELEIVGQQFGWSVRYPGADGKLGSHDFRKISGDNSFGLVPTDSASWDDFIPTEIHLPKGSNVLFKIRAKDVLHSVYAPHFRLKMDAVPGMPTQFYFKPIKTTEEMRIELGNDEFNYEIACAEMCGKGHFGMRYIIIVDEPADYEAWYKKQCENPFGLMATDYLKSTLKYDSKVKKEFDSFLSGFGLEEATKETVEKVEVMDSVEVIDSVETVDSI